MEALDAIVVKDDKILNECRLRNDKEFVKHKILDCIGDFSRSYKYLLKLSILKEDVATNTHLEKYLKIMKTFQL